MSPGHNMREIIKQCIMLEDHLVHSTRLCGQCVSKHFLAMEGLAEECGSLCGSQKAITADARTSADVARQVRVLHHAWASNPKDERTCRRVAEQLRQMRKGLTGKYATLPLHTLPSAEREAVARLIRTKA